jgi:hypothetical protein
MQIMAFNSDLYGDYEQAMKRPNGLAAVAVLLQVITRSSIDDHHSPCRRFTFHRKKVHLLTAKRSL